MVINDNSSDGEEEVIEGSWLSKYTVTPENFKKRIFNFIGVWKYKKKIKCNRIVAKSRIAIWL